MTFERILAWTMRTVIGAALAWAVMWLMLALMASPGLGQERPPASYLPPPRYIDPRSLREPQVRTPSEASRERARVEAERAAQQQQEYYAEDWIVLAPDGTVVCKDPYVRLQYKYVECINKEGVR